MNPRPVTAKEIEAVGKAAFGLSPDQVWRWIGGKRRTLTVKEVEALGAKYGMDPKKTWEWVKKQIGKIGKKLPRPGHGLPSLGRMELLLLGGAGFLMTKDSKTETGEIIKLASGGAFLYALFGMKGK